MEGSANFGRREMKKLSVEDYLACFNHRRPELLNVSPLNQIISMHGFKKHKGLKKDLVDAVSSIELMDLCRSTLMNTDVSGGDASLTLEEVIGDLKDLNWQECHITSLVTLGATDCPTPTAAATKLKCGRKKVKSRSINDKEARPSAVVSTDTAKKARKATDELIPKVRADNSVVSDGAIVAYAGTTSCCEIDTSVPLGTHRSARGRIPNPIHEGVYVWKIPILIHPQ